MDTLHDELMERIENEGRVQFFDLSKDVCDHAVSLVDAGVLEVGAFDTDIYGNEHHLPQMYFIKKRIKEVKID